MADIVAVLGAGVGGLTAAHELAERGFKVRVYERKPIFGGKARSIPVPNSATGGRKPLPGEHGFRFFPSFYRHVPDTMSRIPFGNNQHGVLDNLVATSQSVLARAGLPDVAFPSRYPRDRQEWQTLLRGMMAFGRLVPPRDLIYYMGRWMVWVTSCDARRRSEYEELAWWDFTQATGRSAAYQQFLGDGLTRMLVAIKAREGSTRTVGTIAMQLWMGLMRRGVDVDRLLGGPTNEMWIDPWVKYLEGLGVEFHSSAIVQEIHTDGKRITQVTIEQNGQPLEVKADYYVAALPVEKMALLMTPELKKAAPSMANIDRLRVAWMNGIQFYFANDVPVVHGHAIYADSPWALTSVSQPQFWSNVDLSDYGDGRVRGILSIDISDWESPGILYGKPAKECTPEEIKNEVWAQLVAHLDGPTQRALIRAQLLYWFLDSDIEYPNPSECTNLEPLLINTIGSLADRPSAYTEIPNLFLASDYVRTYTDLASMEAANEAGRRATNALLKRVGSAAKPARIWPLVEPAFFRRMKAWDKLVYKQGLPHSMPKAMAAVLRHRLRVVRRWRRRMARV